MELSSASETPSSPNESASLYDFRVSNDSSGLRFLLKQVYGVKNLLRGDGLRKGIHHRDALSLSILLFCIASFANRCFDGIGTSRNFDVVRLRARDRQHESGGISEIALETDGARALRQLRI